MKYHLNLDLVFWSLGLVAFAAEYLFPAREVKYRAVLLNDLVALAVDNVFRDHCALYRSHSDPELRCSGRIEDSGL